MAREFSLIALTHNYHTLGPANSLHSQILRWHLLFSLFRVVFFLFFILARTLAELAAQKPAI